MGQDGRVNMAVADVVKWDAPKGLYAWKYPSEELGSWSQLIVAESQEAIMVKEGRQLGPFLPGRHTLDTKNYPVLKQFLKIPFSGKTPFTAEVWFVQKAVQLDVKWGTRQALIIKDPMYGIVLPVRAFGQFGVRVEHTKKFLKKLVGTLSTFDESTLREYFKGIVLTKAKTMISKVLIRDKVSILEIATELEAISHEMETELGKEFSEFGLALSKFRIMSISTDEGDKSVIDLKQALGEKMRLDILGTGYKQVRSFDVMDKAAEGDGNTGDLLGAGLGLGMGVGVGVPMARQVAEGVGGEASPPAAAVSTCDKCGTGIPANSKFCPNCGDSYCPCPKCGTDNSEDADRCRQCGEVIASPSPCSKCGELVAVNAKFCGGCGTKVMAAETAACAKCGKELKPGSKFCGECGTPAG